MEIESWVYNSDQIFNPYGLFNNLKNDQSTICIDDNNRYRYKSRYENLCRHKQLLFSETRIRCYKVTDFLLVYKGLNQILKIFSCTLNGKPRSKVFRKKKKNQYYKRIEVINNIKVSSNRKFLVVWFVTITKLYSESRTPFKIVLLFNFLWSIAKSRYSTAFQTFISFDLKCWDFSSKCHNCNSCHTIFLLKNCVGMRLWTSYSHLQQIRTTLPVVVLTRFCLQYHIT